MLTQKVNNLNDLKVKIEYPKPDEFTNEAKGYHHKLLIVSPFTACGMIGGCGVMHLSGLNSVTSYPKNEIEKRFETLKKELESSKTGYPCGTLIGRLGFKRDVKTGVDTELYPGCHKKLLELGFKVVSEYRNEAHPTVPTDWQRLYIYTWTHGKTN